MPRETGLSNRLNILFESLLSGGGADPADTLESISRLLTPQNGAAGLRRFSRLLREAGPLTVEASVCAGCVMHMGGIPAHRIVQFLSLSLPAGISVSQFELAARFMFSSAPSLPGSLLYDLTQYTYLERKLLVQRSVELSTRLTRSITPEMLLYLYLLSLREDLSNENVHLILLILRICFPAVKNPRTTRDISPAEESEIVEAWKSAEHSARYAEALGTFVRHDQREDRAARESASFFLDKYFADGALETLSGTKTGAAASGRGAAADAGAAAGGRAADARGAGRTREATGPRPVPRKGTAAATSAGTASKVRLRGRAKKQAAPGHRRTVVSGPRARTVPQKSAGEAAGALSAPRSPYPGARDGAAVHLRLAAPFGLAAVVLLAVVAANHHLPAWSPPRTRPSVLLTAPAQPAETVQAAATPAAGSSSHLVQKGDSLWKIYRALQSEGSWDKGWQDFLQGVSRSNSLRDPDAIFPGSVLVITPEKK